MFFSNREIRLVCRREAPLRERPAPREVGTVLTCGLRLEARWWSVSLKKMKKRTDRGVTRRAFVKGAGVALATGALPASCARKVLRVRKTLRIIQWSHYVPRYDQWFDKVFTKE